MRLLAGPPGGRGGGCHQDGIAALDGSCVPVVNGVVGMPGGLAMRLVLEVAHAHVPAVLVPAQRSALQTCAANPPRNCPFFTPRDRILWPLYVDQCIIHSVSAVATP